MAKVRRAESRLYQILGREPTDEEIAAETEFGAHRVVQMRTAALQPLSLHASLDEDQEGMLLLDIIRDVNTSSPDQEFAERTLARTLRTLLARLNPREQRILPTDSD